MSHARRFLISLIVLFHILGFISVLYAQQNEITVTTVHNARLRSGPGTRYDILATIPYNTNLPAVARNTDTTWVLVNYDGTQGWLAVWLLRWSGTLDVLPISDGQTIPVQTQPSEGQVTGRTGSALNVRSGPSINDVILGQLPAGTTVGLTGRTGEGNRMWVRFSYEGQDAWLAGWLITVSGDVNSLPIVTPTPVVTTPTPIPGSTYVVYAEGGANEGWFVPSGWMGDLGDLSINEAFTGNVYRGSRAIQITYTANGSGPNVSCNYTPPCRWAGVYWQHPADNWAEIPNAGMNLTGFSRLTFWARADHNMRVEFFVGGMTGGAYPDSLQPQRSTGYVQLSPTWTQFTIDLTNGDLSYIIGGFGFATNWDNANGGSFYLDNIQFER